MAETKDVHIIVDIPVNEEHQKLSLPIASISESPGHLLLLKLWQREEGLFGRRMAGKETRLDSIRREIFQICCFFFLFHGLFFFTSLGRDQCRRWWIPGLLSASTSLVLALLVQGKIRRFWKVREQLQRERSDHRTLSRCIQQLRMRGASFDLSKELQTSCGKKKMKMKMEWRIVTWCGRYLITVALVCFAALMLPAFKFLLCGI